MGNAIMIRTKGAGVWDTNGHLQHFLPLAAGPSPALYRVPTLGEGVFLAVPMVRREGAELNRVATKILKDNGVSFGVYGNAIVCSRVNGVAMELDNRDIKDLMEKIRGVAAA